LNRGIIGEMETRISSIMNRDPYTQATAENPVSQRRVTTKGVNPSMV